MKVRDEEPKDIAEYYPRFVFERASLYGIKCQWEVPDEAFMIWISDNPETVFQPGKAFYRPEFNL